VDVVIPTRDRHALVAEAVRSALRQSHRDLAVWVVDNGSERPVELPPDVRADERVRLLRADGVATPSHARNAALAQARAEYVAFLDDDDCWHGQKLERQLRVMEAAPERVGMVACGFALQTPGYRRRDYIPHTGADLRRRLLEHPVFWPSTVMVRRTALDAAGGFREQTSRVEDWYLWVQLTDRFDVEVIPEILVERRESSTPPEVLLSGHRAIHDLLRDRIDALPSRERERLHARHEFDQAVQMARAGRGGEARRALLAAWRRYPLHLRPLLHVGRTLTGERAWALGARAARLGGRGRL
jgi:hypothetical protein